jgi:glycine cleavage system aminomethyltransferase T
MLVASGAMLHDEVAHYGSAAAEIAVCTKAVGLVERSELRLLEVTGDEALLDHALVPAVPGQVPGPRRARRVADTWCCRIAADRALVVGAAGAVDRWRQVVSHAAATTGIAVAANALPHGEAVSIVGPKASTVLRSTSLPADLAPGGVDEGRLAGSPVSVVCEDRERYLLLFPDGCAAAALAAIADSGRPVGLARVGHEALAHLRAARRDNG